MLVFSVVAKIELRFVRNGGMGALEAGGKECAVGCVFLHMTYTGIIDGCVCTDFFAGLI